MGFVREEVPDRACSKIEVNVQHELKETNNVCTITSLYLYLPVLQYSTVLTTCNFDNTQH